jgi:hypothetical protein
MKHSLDSQLWEETEKLKMLNVSWFTVTYPIINGVRAKSINIDLWGNGSDEFSNMVLKKTKKFNKLFDTKIRIKNGV